jgi:hypothetical protein
VPMAQWRVAVTVLSWQCLWRGDSGGHNCDSSGDDMV